jgi:ornithine cyclodeaminase/alanine dehydrogenase-like protein (mu-crystallin family)
MALVLTRRDVLQLINMEKAIEVMEDVFRQQGEGKIVGHPSFGLSAGKGYFRIHAGGLLGSKAIGVRIFPARPQWPAGTRERHVAVIYDTDSAELLCISASPFGRLRIGAVMGLAARYLSRLESSTVAMIGVGRNAPGILRAILVVRPSVREVAVYGRDRGRRERFAEETAPLLGIKVYPAESAEEAVREKDIVLTSTDSPVPVLEAKWITPGGYFASSGMTSEVGPDIIEKAKRIVLSSKHQIRHSPARKEDALNQSIDQGALSWEDVDELGDVVCGRSPRQNPVLSDPEGITVFLQASGGFPELALTVWAFKEARKLGLGKEIELWE